MPAVRFAAMALGVAWIAAVAAGFVVFLATGQIRGFGRGGAIFLFVVAVPGIWLFRWGRGENS